MSRHLMGVGDQPNPTPNDAPSAHDLVVADIIQRKEFGLDKYGSLLQPGNGRKSIRDAYEELLDGACYLRTVLEEERAGKITRDQVRVCTSPKVTTLAYTRLNPAVIQADEIVTANGDRMTIETGASDLDTLGEFAGRACYQSFGKPNPDTRAVRDYFGHILVEGHESILEHSSVTFYITGVSRAFTHELIRHRHLSYSQLSQRFVNGSGSAIVIPPALVQDPAGIDLLAEAHVEATRIYSMLVDSLAERGLERKPAREAARAVLGNMVETRIVVTGNLRAWRDVIARRAAPAADAEIRRVSVMLLRELAAIAPAAFQDFVIDQDGMVSASAYKDPDF